MKAAICFCPPNYAQSTIIGPTNCLSFPGTDWLADLNSTNIGQVFKILNYTNMTKKSLLLRIFLVLSDFFHVKLVS